MSIFSSWTKKKTGSKKPWAVIKRWLPTIIFCIIFDTVCIACKGSVDTGDFSPLLLANAAFCLVTQCRRRRIESTVERRTRRAELKARRKEQWSGYKAEKSKRRTAKSGMKNQ